MTQSFIPRTYRRRNRTVKLEELGNWVAINDPADNDTQPAAAPELPAASAKPRGHAQAPAPQRAAKARPRAMAPAADSIRNLVDEAAQVCFDTLEASGWRFEQRGEATQRAASQDHAKVYINEFGNIVLGTNRLTVKFPSETPYEAAKSMLARFGCTILKALPFGEEMYEIEIIDPKQGDSIDVASKLNASGLFEFAEPSLIETVSNRQ
jgi:hypothetical protein